MRSTVTVMIAAACFTAAACGSDSTDDRAGDAVAMDTMGTGVSVPSATEVATSPGDDGAQGADDTERSPAGADRGNGAEDRADSTPPAAEPEGRDGADDDVDTIPAAFRGEWNGDRSDCGTGNSVTRLRISADRLRFYESVATVRDVKVESDRVITVTADYEGEGQTWQETRRFSLSADGNSLTATNGSSLVRHRCP
ncbi:MAG TPA: hypothetical protein VFU06_16960 [Longimicrobiales bacterium]|nr:hypothetical protein [Longimicrobiales bacterium]